MTQDFGELLRQAIDSDEVEVPADTGQAIAAGRRIVRGRRIGWGLGACAVVAAAVLVLPGVLQRPVAAVPAQPVGTVSASPVPADGWLIGTEWSVVTLGGAAIVPGTSMTLQFGDGVVTGFGGCNGFGYGMTGTTVHGGWYRQAGDRLTIGQVASRAALCGSGISEQETTYFRTLTDVRGFSVAGDTLTLLGADDTVLIELGRVPVELDRTGWRVTPIDGAATATGRKPYLLFHEGGLYAYDGCNFSNGTFSQAGDRLIVDVRVTTLIACAEPAIQGQEPAFDAAALKRVYRAVVDSGRLHLLDQAGAELLEAIPDAALVLERDRFTWRLLGENDVTQVTLQVGNGRLTGRTGCGDYTADYTRTGDAWTVTDVQRRNVLPCANTASADSERFLGQLQTVTRVQATENQLQLITPEEVLFFTRK